MIVNHKFIVERSVGDLEKFKEIVQEVIDQVKEGDLDAYDYFLFESEGSGAMPSLHQLLAIRFAHLQELKGQEWPFDEKDEKDDV